EATAWKSRAEARSHTRQIPHPKSPWRDENHRGMKPRLQPIMTASLVGTGFRPRLAAAGENHSGRVRLCFRLFRRVYGYPLGACVHSGMIALWFSNSTRALLLRARNYQKV